MRTLTGHGDLSTEKGHQTITNIFPEGSTRSQEFNVKHRGSPRCCAGATPSEAARLPLCPVTGPWPVYSFFVFTPLACSRSQDHGSMGTAREGEGCPGPSCSSEKGVQAREGRCKAWASWSQPGVQPALLPLPGFRPSIRKLPGSPSPARPALKRGQGSEVRMSRPHQSSWIGTKGRRLPQRNEAPKEPSPPDIWGHVLKSRWLLPLGRRGN